MSSPYSGLPRRQFWTHAVAPATLTDVSDIYRKRFSIDGLKVATAGSCFAQHIARNLRANGYTVVDAEPAPANLAKLPVAEKYHYGLYSARHGNIYTVRRLLQLAQEATCRFSPSPDLLIWEHEGRYHDALRPQVEPHGLLTREEVLLQRQDHLKRFAKVLKEADVFVFTLGLTEAWAHKSGLVYSITPGAPYGSYDPEAHTFVNFRFQEIYDDFVAFRALARASNPGMKFLLTVSPVPLTASYVDAHVLPSTVRSKSVLRAVTAQLYEDFEDVDYFPSYELLSTPFLGPSQFEPNKRDVSRRGVASVMQHFFAEHPPLKTVRVSRKGKDATCEEALLEAFA